jgi:hypothetical protein
MKINAAILAAFAGMAIGAITTGTAHAQATKTSQPYAYYGHHRIRQHGKGPGLV